MLKVFDYYEYLGLNYTPYFNRRGYTTDFK